MKTRRSLYFRPEWSDSAPPTRTNLRAEFLRSRGKGGGGVRHTIRKRCLWKMIPARCFRAELPLGVCSSFLVVEETGHEISPNRACGIMRVIRAMHGCSVCFAQAVRVSATSKQVPGSDRSLTPSAGLLMVQFLIVSHTTTTG